MAATPGGCFRALSRSSDACAETDQEFVWVYRCQSEGPFELDAEEVERGGWFAPQEVTRWMAERPQEFASAARLIWKRWCGGTVE